MYNNEILFLKALAKSVHPFTGEVADKDSILNSPDVIRGIYDICDILSSFSINTKKIKKTNFVMTYDMLQKYPYENKKISLSEILRRLYQITPNMKKLTYSQVSKILIEKGLLKSEISSSGREQKVCTDKFMKYGVSNESRRSVGGVLYKVVLYDYQGQQFVLDFIYQHFGDGKKISYTKNIIEASSNNTEPINPHESYKF